MEKGINMEEVKNVRCGQSGDRVVIVEKDSPAEPYDVGQEFTILRRTSNCSVVTTCGFALYDTEYMVLDEGEVFPEPTSDKEMVDELVKHFLGEGWYEVNPMPRSQVNTEALNLIKELFPL